MQTDWYVIVDGQQVFAGMSPTGRLLWEDRVNHDTIQVALFPQPEMPAIPKLPTTAEMIHLTEL